MMNEMNVKFPANCDLLSECEKMETVGGSVAESAVKTVIALGVSGLALCAMGTFAKNADSIIQGSITWGQNFIDSSMAWGERFLQKLMGISPLN